MTADFFQFQAQLRRPRAGAAPPASAHQAALSVSELTEKIKKLIHGGLPQSLFVQGEVSNFTRTKSSGHLYFTLKDPKACIDCVMFASEAARLKFEPGDGMELLAGGRVGVYPQRGRYQLYIDSLRPLGQGALELAFQQVRARLAAEGLFAAERKRPLPAYPIRIVLVTSREAAALHDVLKVLRAFAWLRLMLYPVPVQGDGAAARIAAAIDHVNAVVARIGGADVIVLARGGGSLEDLWAFNEEAVARAMARSGIPIVTGIGHEVDVSIADLVADHHAHTPTEAARVLTARWREAGADLAQQEGRLTRSLRVILSDGRQRLRAIERHEAFRRPMDTVYALRQLLDERHRTLIIAEERIARLARDRVQTATARLERFMPAVLPHYRELLDERRARLDDALRRQLRRQGERLVRFATKLQECHPRFGIRLEAQRLQAAQDRFGRAMGLTLDLRTARLAALARQLESVSPQSVLRRGYTITARKRDGGTPLRSAAGLKQGEKLITRFADGQVESTIEDSKQLSLFDG